MFHPDGRLHILTYNIHKGFSQSRKFVLGAIKKAMQTTQADLVFLQEVYGEHKGHSRRVKEWPTTTQLEYLADSVWPHFAYGKNAIYSDGHHGNAILSRHPISKWENIDISNNRFERRGLLHATLEPITASAPPIHAVCVHLDLFEQGRSNQIRRIIKRIQEHVPEESPLILAGDFNDWRERATQILEHELHVSEVYQSLHGRHATSFPAWFPFLKLDRIYVRGFRSLQARCFTEEPWSALSDHGALIAEIEQSTTKKK